MMIVIIVEILPIGKKIFVFINSYTIYLYTVYNFFFSYLTYLKLFIFSNFHASKKKKKNTLDFL